jgi:3-oxoisoapionate decarboxylase
MMTHNPQTNPVTRREFIASACAATLAAQTLAAKPPRKTYGIAYTSFPVRLRQAAQNNPGKRPALPAEEFIERCREFGGDGCQMDINLLASRDAAYLKSIRALLDRHGMYLELAVSARTLESADTFAPVAAAAHELGVGRLRVACLGGRRYEDFSEMAKWQEFVNHWKRVLGASEPILKKHKLLVGVENHKDWLADELVEILKSAGSEYLGACVDFGNNFALLEDALEVAEKLAPYAVTTHLKDMAVKPYADGFELSEVPLGEGIVPLAKIINLLRAKRSDINICLEMITRDPLKVPYKTEQYWATYERRDDARIKKFEAKVLSRASKQDLPRVTGLSAEQALAAENENLRRSAAYAHKQLGL